MTDAGTRGIAWRILVPFGLVTTSVTLTLAVLEVGLRLLSPAHPLLPDAVPLPPGAVVLRTVMQLARPNVRGFLPTGVPYRANASGFRGPEYARPKPPGVFRIAVIGDSITMGAGIAEEGTYSARVERALDDPPGPVRYEVLNLGLAGLNATHIVERFERIGLPYDPDLIVYGYTLNDIEGPDYRTSSSLENVQGALARGMARSGLYVTTFFRTRLRSLRELFWPPKGSYVWELDDNYFHNPPALAAVDAAFGKLEALARSRDACVLVLQHPNLVFLHRFHPFRRHYAAVAALAEAHGFFEADTLDYFVGHDGLGLWVSAFDPHPNAAGHALLAQAALDALRSLPERCWKRS